MRLIIEIVAAVLLMLCIGATGAALAAGEVGRTGNLSCVFSVPQEVLPAVRCLAIKRQCGGTFYADYCGDKMLADR